jgi:hypothetical protein
MLHFLKTWPQYFEQIRLKRKTFEIRRDDRGPNGGPGFMMGDVLVLEEWVPVASNMYLDTEGRPLLSGSTGRFIVTGPIPYIMRGASFGLEAGHVIMSLVDTALMEAAAGGQPPLTREMVTTLLQGLPEFKDKPHLFPSFYLPKDTP